MNISVGTSGIIFVAINPQISPMQPRARRINSFQWLVPTWSGFGSFACEVVQQIHKLKTMGFCPGFVSCWSSEES